MNTANDLKDSMRNYTRALKYNIICHLKTIVFIVMATIYPLEALSQNMTNNEIARVLGNCLAKYIAFKDIGRQATASGKQSVAGNKLLELAELSVPKTAKQIGKYSTSQGEIAYNKEAKRLTTIHAQLFVKEFLDGNPGDLATCVTFLAMAEGGHLADERRNVPPKEFWLRIKQLSQ